ncbi:MAG: hypothetical protein JWM11_7822 [Planctomycetaceae bacterium]|nr:hypothetical protein [Planctomycetaceae bacterium]
MSDPWILKHDSASDNKNQISNQCELVPLFGIIVISKQSLSIRDRHCCSVEYNRKAVAQRMDFRGSRSVPPSLETLLKVGDTILSIS